MQIFSPRNVVPEQSAHTQTLAATTYGGRRRKIELNTQRVVFQSLHISHPTATTRREEASADNEKQRM